MTNARIPQPPRRPTIGHWPTLAAACALAATLACPLRAQAQCPGDCNSNLMVAINELVLAVNIALGSAQVSACQAIDRDNNGMASINELIAAVNAALNGCPDENTPTPTMGGETPTPTATPPTPTPTEPLGGVCGNNVVELEEGETCDDGNTDDTDSCPANCRVATCTPSEQRLRVDLSFATDDEELLLIGMGIFLRYPDGTVSIPASLDQQPVRERVTSDIFALGLNDTDFSLKVQATDSLQFGYQEGVALSVEFDVCEGATVSPDAFTCVITDGVDTAFNSIPGDRITCELSFVQ